MKYLASTWAVVLIIGPFFGGHLRPEDTLHGRAAMLSNMRYHTSVIIALFSSLGVLGSSGKKLMRLGAYADRIADTERAVRAIRNSTDEGAARSLSSSRILRCQCEKAPTRTDTSWYLGAVNPPLGN